MFQLMHLLGSHFYFLILAQAYPPVKRSEFEHVRTTAQVHSCKVTTQWYGFHRFWKSSNQIFDTVQLSLPQFSYESEVISHVITLQWCFSWHNVFMPTFNLLHLFLNGGNRQLGFVFPNQYKKYLEKMGWRSVMVCMQLHMHFLM